MTRVQSQQQWQLSIDGQRGRIRKKVVMFQLSENDYKLGKRTGGARKRLVKKAKTTQKAALKAKGQRKAGGVTKVKAGRVEKKGTKKLTTPKVATARKRGNDLLTPRAHIKVLVKDPLFETKEKIPDDSVRYYRYYAI